PPYAFHIVRALDAFHSAGGVAARHGGWYISLRRSVPSIPTDLLALDSGFPNLPDKPQPSHLVLLAAADVDTLRARAMATRTRLADTGRLEAVSFPSDTRALELHTECRLALLGASAPELVDRLDLAVHKLTGRTRERFQAKGAVFFEARA